MNELEAYYGKYNEEKRLLRPYGRIEYLTTMKYIHDFIGERKDMKILEVGAGTGRYSVTLAEEGYDITAVELVNYNLGILKQKAERKGLTNIRAFQGNALNLKKCADASFDLVLILGPLYHLFSFKEKVRALQEARRVVKKDGAVFAAYIMNDFGVIQYGFKEGHANEALESGKLDSTFHIRNDITDLFDFVTLSDIETYNEAAGLERIKIVAADGAANYMRETISGMDEALFEAFFRYHLTVCERPDLMGASCHTLDILKKNCD